MIAEDGAQSNSIDNVRTNVRRSVIIIDTRLVLCDTASSEPGGATHSAILTEEEVVPKMDSSLKRSAVASLLALR